MEGGRREGGGREGGRREGGRGEGGREGGRREEGRKATAGVHVYSIYREHGQKVRSLKRGMSLTRIYTLHHIMYIIYWYTVYSKWVNPS